MKKVIVNGDDFGLHSAINRGISEAFQYGCLTSTSLMAGGAAFEEAVGLAGSLPALGVGVHLTAVAGQPVLPSEEIPSLVTAQGAFRAGHIPFLRDYFLGRIALAELERE